MKRDGYITLLVLVVFGFCVTTGYFVCERVFMQSRLLANRKESIQSSLLLESQVYNILINESILYRDFLEEIIYATKKTSNTTYDLDIEFDDVEINKAQIRFENDKDGRLVYRLMLEGRFSDLKDTLTAKGNVYKPVVDNCDNGLVTFDGMSLEDSQELESLIKSFKEGFIKELVPSSYYLAHNYLENHVVITTDDRPRFNIRYVRDEGITSETPRHRNLVLFKEYDGFKRDLVRIQENGKGFVKGLIYLEDGDLVMSGPTEIYGIVVLENGHLIKEGEGGVSIKGKVIMASHKKPDPGINIEYHQESFRQAAKYFPGVVSPGIYYIR